MWWSTGIVPHPDREGTGSSSSTAEWKRPTERIAAARSRGIESSLGGQAAAKDHKIIHAAPLYHLFALSVQEIRKRFAGNGSYRALSPRHPGDPRGARRRLVRETQRLNRMMVLLTIAISGGPFLGLLGTVVGVMITFAAIAATGDVNVNAIAPGIAAALVATVAGLGVAIPALFGYN